MSGDLLHLIRDAEKKAEKIINDATLEARKIIEEARSEAKQILRQASTGEIKEESKQLVKTREKYKAKILELEIEGEKQRNELKEKASKKKEEAIDYVTRAILLD